MMPVVKQFEHLKLQLEAIKSATNNFADDNCIGRGGFGRVYKGELLLSDGQTIVAIKRLDRAFGQGNPEFWKEIIMLSLYKHENIVSLLGFCDESDEKILVYEYASKGSLDLYLNKDYLTWIQRLKICIGAARGLAYLHNPGGSQQRVLHRDIKSSNILLDDNWNARISDLGLSKFGPANQQYTFLVSNTVGTFGYCDPLYVESGLLTKESDVYSFGVVLFEILCGRLSICYKIDIRHRSLISLVREYYEENKINKIVYSKIQDEINPKSLEAFTTVAYQCLHTNCKKRPLMTQVVSTLEKALAHQLGTLLANAESSEVVDGVPRSVDGSDKTEIVDSSSIKSLRLPDPTAAGKVMQLIYTDSGSGLLVLDSSGIHKLWKWQKREDNLFGKATTSIVPELWQPTNGAVMSNDLNESKPAEESAACIVLSKNENYILSASGGKISMFNMLTFKVVTTFMPHPPAATYLAFHPEDEDIIAIGKDDSTIEIYNVRFDEVIIRLEGHQKQITGLVFSKVLNLLVSSGADAQVCLWNINGWVKLKSRSLQSPPGYPSSLVGDTKIQCHGYKLYLLVVHESQIAIYDRELECSKLWFPRKSLSAPISSATYSCDCLLIFTGFLDGAVGVFDAESLRLQFRISPSAYISPLISSTANPMVVEAHPFDRKQLALGMSNGSVYVIELACLDQKWGTIASSNPSNSALSNLPLVTRSKKRYRT